MFLSIIIIITATTTTTTEWEETFGSDGYVCGIISQVCTYLQTHQVVDIKYALLFVCPSYLNKVV